MRDMQTNKDQAGAPCTRVHHYGLGRLLAALMLPLAVAKTRALKLLVRRGIPNEYRGEFWKSFAGSNRVPSPYGSHPRNSLYLMCDTDVNTLCCLCCLRRGPVLQVRNQFKHDYYQELVASPACGVETQAIKEIDRDVGRSVDVSRPPTALCYVPFCSETQISLVPVLTVARAERSQDIEFMQLQRAVKRCGVSLWRILYIIRWWATANRLTILQRCCFCS